MRVGALVIAAFLTPLGVFLLASLPAAAASAAVIDDFNDGNYTGGLAAWTVQSGSWGAASLELRNQPTAASNYRISTPHTQTQGSWQWSFRHNASAGLNDVMRFHFMQSGSSDAQLSSGYYVFSNTANNFYKLIQWSGGVGTDLIATTQSLGTGWHTGRVDRGVGGGFALYYGATLVGTAVDDTFLPSSYIGVRNNADSTDDWVAMDDIQFTAAAATAPTVTVSAPNGGETWYRQGTYSITWIASPGTNPLKANPISIYYGTSGTGPWTLLTGSLANSGSYSWNIPSAFATGSYFIRVRAEDNAVAANVGYDASNSAFTVAAPIAPTVTITKPIAGESITAQAQYTVQYTASQGTFPFSANPIALDYSTDGGTSWLPIAGGQLNTGSYVWTVPNLVATNAIIRVCASDDRAPANSGCGQVTFNIVAATPPSTTVQQPNGGETWGLNGTYQIKWGASAGSFPLATNPFGVYVSTTGSGGPWTTLATGVSTLTYNWVVNVSLSNNSYVRVCAKDDRPAPNSGCDASDSAFAIVSALPPTVTVVAPNGGENLVIGSAFPIRWTATPGTHPLKANPIAIHLSLNSTSGPWTLLAQNLTNSGSYAWNVPANVTCAAAIRVRAEDNQAAPNVGTDYSDSNFCIVVGNGAPQVSLASPAPGARLRGQVKVEWDGSDVNGDLVAYKVQSSADSGATWIDRATVSFIEGPAPQRRNATVDTKLITDGLGYWLRVNATDPNGSSSSSQVSNITIDNTPPASTHDKMVGFVKTTTFNTSWKGTDATSGIAFYDVLVSVNGSGAVPWKNATSSTSAPYNGTDGGKYGFTFLATDRAGNRETKPQHDILVVVDSKPPTTKAGPLPAFVDLVSFPVPFTAIDLPVNGSVSVELFYRSPTQQAWAKVGSFNSSPAQFTPVEAGLHEFYCIGTDGAGNVESKSAAKETEIFVDAYAPVPSVSTRVEVTNQNTATFETSAHDNEGLAEARLYDWWSSDNSSYTTSVQAWSKTMTGGPKDFSESASVMLSKDGYHRIEAYARDLAGKETRGAFTYIRVDTEPPTVVAGEPAKSGVPTDAHVRIQFNESMQPTATEAAVKVDGTNITPSSTAWSRSDRLEFDLKALPGNTTVKITIGSGARDLADNALVPYEFSFTTIPTTGAIGGKVLDAAKRPITGATVTARGGGAERRVATAADGSFNLRDLEPGLYEISVSAEGYKPAGGTVTVVTAQTARADFILETELSLATIGMYSAAGIVALALLVGLVVLARRRSRCPSCSAKLRNGRCANCGYVKTGEPKKGRAPVAMHPAAKPSPATLKTIGRKVGPGGAPVTAGTASAPPPGMNVPLLEPVEAAKRSDRCMACGAMIPKGEDWCPKCGQAVGSVEDETATCPKCEGAMLEGTCLLCGFSIGGPPEVSEENRMKRPEQSCPRCRTTLKDGARFCDSCGADLLKIRMGKEPARQSPTMSPAAVVTPPPQAAPQPPAPPLSIPAPPGLGMVPPAGPSSSGTDVKIYCRTCGTLAPKDLPICDVCGEPLGK